jgi:fatty acid-binding protein DegV
MTPKGKMDVDGITFGRKNVVAKFRNYVLKKVKGRPIKRIGISHADHLEVATQLQHDLKQHYPQAEHYLAEVCPSLGTHGGHHTIGVAVQFED